MAGYTVDPNDPRINRVTVDDDRVSQDEVYLILSDEERSKGFVKPYRQSYQHVGMAAPTNPLRDLTQEEQKRHKGMGYVKYEQYPESESPKVGKYWTQAELDRIGNGCMAVTTMSQPLAETWARDPHFYGATYCAGCGKHRPVDEFVWDGTRIRLGD